MNATISIAEIKEKRNILEANLFGLVYQFTQETGVTPCEIVFEWADSEIISKKHTVRQLIEYIVKIEI